MQRFPVTTTQERHRPVAINQSVCRMTYKRGIDDGIGMLNASPDYNSPDAFRVVLS